MAKTIMRNGFPLFDLVERGSRTMTSATLSQELLTDDSATIKIESNSVLDIKINDYMLIDGSVYRINQLPSVEKLSEKFYVYDIKLEGLMFDLKRCKFFNADANDFKTDLEFLLIGNLELFLTTIRNNMKRFSVNWEIGNYTANTETKSLTFSSDSCLSALQKICQEYKIEFWIKQEGGKFKIHTGAFGATLPTTLEYGKGKGLYSLSRKNVNDNEVVSRLYVNGGSSNIPNDYRNFSKNLLLPDISYLEDTALIAEIGLIEGSITFEDIYPKRTGVISELGDVKFKFSDSSMDFDLNEKEADGITTKYLIAGTSAKIHFNTGNLAGYQFEIKKYVHATKTFEIIPFTNEQGQKFPDETKEAFQFSVGDEYKILDIYMPETYITNAENELLTKATEQFNLLKQPKVSYGLNTDPEFIKIISTPIQIGDMIRVKDFALGIDKVLRVQKVLKNLITNEVENIEIADSYEVNFASKLILDVKEIKNVVNITNLGEINYSKLGLKTTEELKNLIFDTDGYFDAENIRPFSIETNMLTVGSRSQQVSLSCEFRLNENGNPNAITVRAGQLFSQTLDKTWNVPLYSITLPDSNFRYVYIKASKTSSVGSVYFSSEKIQFDSDPNDYYFLAGILHTIVDNVRILSLTIGTTTISGGLVRTGIISSLDGQTTFNLNTGQISGKISFSSGSTGYNNITDKPDLSSFESARDYVNNGLKDTLEDLKNRADGVIESWFYSHSPTLSNLPASNWTTNEEKDKHIGDTFTNMQEFIDNATTPDAGKAWRFTKNTDGSYSWNLIANSDSTKALIEAGKAKDTADSKRRVFVEQPFPPYEEGDLWAQGVSGDLMRCKQDRLSGVFVSSDWEKASKYTDDTAVKNLKIGGRNLIIKYDDGGIIKLYGANATKTIIKDSTLPSGNYFHFADVVRERPQYVFFFQLSASGNILYESIYGKTITVSFYMRANVPQELMTEKGGKDFFYETVNTEWKKVELSFEYLGGNLHFFSMGDGLTSFDVHSIKIEVGNKSTEWTPSPEDVEAKITEAQNSADTANSTLRDIASDNVLTPSEKQSTKKEWDVIASEKSVVEQQALPLNISIVSYQSSYNSLSAYLTPLLGNLTTNSQINGTEFRGKFKAYYDEKILLLKAVTDKLKSNTDNIQIGGRNLLRRFSQYTEKNKHTIVATSDDHGVKTEGRVTIEPYTKYTLSFKTDATHTGDNGSDSIEMFLIEPSWSFLINMTTTEFKPIESSYTFFSGNRKGECIFRWDVNKSGKTYSIWDVKIEKGDKPTDWSPAPEDVDDKILATEQKVIEVEKKTNFLTSTTIDGNVVATGLLMVGDENGANAGISGISDLGNQSVRLFAGGSASNRNGARFQVLDDGTVKLNHVDGKRGWVWSIRDGSPVLEYWSKTGAKLFELGERGFLAVSYVPESWTEAAIYQFTFNSATYDEAALKAELLSAIQKTTRRVYFQEPGKPIDTNTEFSDITEYNITPNLQAFEYDNGTHPDNAQYANLIGYKKTNNSRTDNINNGWYLERTGMVWQESTMNSPAEPLYTFTMVVAYFSSGKIAQTKFISITK